MSIPVEEWNSDVMLRSNATPTRIHWFHIADYHPPKDRPIAAIVYVDLSTRQKVRPKKIVCMIRWNKETERWDFLHDMYERRFIIKLVAFFPLPLPDNDHEVWR